jgi:4-diphosphocytidyl-2-C-methyl-D-erythritol kinase
VTRAAATAKLNLGLVVGRARDDGKHEVTTVLQRLALADRVELTPSPALVVDGFAGDTLVRDALRALADAAGIRPQWRARITKRIPVASGLGGGSSDAATALRLANATLPEPVSQDGLLELARTIGADVPFFLTNGPQLGEREGAHLSQLDLPQDYFVVLFLPKGAAKISTAAVYTEFDRRNGGVGYEERRSALLDALEHVRRPRDLVALPPNDLASSPFADELRTLGAFRADVSGAGPAVYGLFHHREPARRACRSLRGHGRSWLTGPAWYG